jgi:hypothetical protein
VWPLRNLSCFCDDPGEWHAICEGVGDALSFAPFKYDEKEAHYYKLARGVTTASMILALWRMWCHR